MDFSPVTIAENFVDLALSLDLHFPGYIDAYFGPAEWKNSVQARGITSLDKLTENAQRLAQEISISADLSSQRKDFLSRQVKAMHTILRRLQGERISLVDEVESVFDITPVFQDEAAFEAAHQTLDELLPPGGTIQERMIQRKKELEIPKDQLPKIVPEIIEFLRKKTHERYCLPEQEAFELAFVENQPWGANLCYLGNYHSRIEFNTDLPFYISGITNILAHEGYPGHHTELCNKEAKLYQEKGYTEFCLVLTNDPSSVVSEGIANIAIEALIPEDERIAWLEGLYARAGFGHLNVLHQMKISEAYRKLDQVTCNAEFLLNEQGADKNEVCAYIQKFGLRDARSAEKQFEFISNPTYRTYIFTYEYGEKAIRELFEKKGNREYWFTRLLTEPVTPSQIRNWIAE